MKKIQGLMVFVLLGSTFLLAPIPGLADSGSKTTESIPFFASFLEQEKTVFAAERASSDGPVASLAGRASRIARVAINTDAIDAAKIAPGDGLSVGLFDNTSLEATIDKITISNKITTIRGKISGADYGYIITTVDENRVLTIIELPAEGYQYKIVYDNDLKTHILYKTPLSALDNLEGAPSLIPPPLSNDSPILQDASTEIAVPTANTTIDVMVVYTPAAKSYASTRGGIDSIINQAMANAQLALDNSNTSINMQLVHSAQVTYTESGDSSDDLSRLTSTSDGFMDNVHTLRDQYGADIVTLFTKVEDTGGIGWLLQYKSGRSAYAFNIVRIQQGTGLTQIHEIGHNMGAHHHKDQSTQPGPTFWRNNTWDENTWSAGWTWEDSGSSRDGYCTLMSYEGGFLYGNGTTDSRTYHRVAYFSNPAIYGDSADGDNAQTLREMRTVIAAYRTPAAPECTIDADCEIGEVCSNNECVECADDGDCIDGECTNNVCIPYDCVDDAGCTGDDVCADNYCVECANDTHCDGDDVCSNNACVECADDSNCTGGEVCSNNNTCVECAGDSDCVDATCESNICIPYECIENDDCTGAELCSNHVCVECAGDGDCSDDLFCNGEERCTSGVCSSGTDPCDAGELCNEEDNICIEPAECEEDDDCDIGVCLVDTCVECRINDDCTGEEVCSEDNTCVECADDDDCSDGACSYDNVCVECVDDDDCPDGACMDNACVDCVENDDCTSNICLNNKCLECMTWVECNNGDVCQDNVCVECTVDDDCDDGICLDTMCTECEVDADCDRGMCINNMCAVGGSVQIDKFSVKAGKNGKGDSLKFAGLADAAMADFNDDWGGTVIVTLTSENIPDPDAATFTFPINSDSFNNFKYKSKIKPLDKTAPATALQLDTIKGKMKFSGKNLDLSGLSCPISLTIQIGTYTAEIVLDETIVNGTKKPCPPELMTGF